MKIVAEIITALVLLVVAAISYFVLQYFMTGPLPEFLAIMIGAVAAIAVRYRVRSRR